VTGADVEAVGPKPSRPRAAWPRRGGAQPGLALPIPDASRDDAGPSAAGQEHHRNTVSVPKLLVILALVTVLSRTINDPQSGLMNLYLSVVWSVYAPLVLCGIVAGARHRRVRLSRFPGRSERHVIFSVPSVCRPDTLPALVRVIESVRRHAPRNLADFVVEVVIDEVGDGTPAASGRREATLELLGRYAGVPEVRVLVVPRGFRTPNGTLFKARANQYALELRRRDGRGTADTYVYHLDDDTHVGADTVASIAEFIHLHHGRYYLAQGVLTFPFELTPSWTCRLLDSIRPIDDLTRFRFFTGMLGRPLLGLHGEHLLVRADVEDAIGWDFGPVLVEDAYFALRFSASYPGRSTTLRSFSYGASPATVPDLIRQRRRWAAGLIRLCSDRSFPLRVRLPLAYAVGSWILGPFQSALPLYGLALLLGTYNTSPFSHYVVYVWCVNFSYFLWQYLEGFKINLSVSSVRRRALVRAVGPLALIPGVWLLSLVEATGVLLGLWQAMFSRRVSFDVIAKRF
jgi:egghead protein (zeste-white 4 protein)